MVVVFDTCRGFIDVSTFFEILRLMYLVVVGFYVVFVFLVVGVELCFTFRTLGRDAVLRRLAKIRKRWKITPSQLSWAVVAGGLASGCQQVSPVDYLRLLHVLDKPPLAQSIYRLSDGGYGSPPGVCAWRGWSNGVYGVYLGGEV